MPRRVSDASAISIHALRGEGDTEADGDYIYDGEFQSTPSVGRATLFPPLSIFAPGFQSTPSVGRATALHFLFSAAIAISIHALRGEGDKFA